MVLEVGIQPSDSMFGSFLPSLWLVRNTKAYFGLGADIVMESITLATRRDATRNLPQELLRGLPVPT
jgi:hypothetical protein